MNNNDLNFSYLAENGDVQLKRSNISHLVEHPLQMRPPSKTIKYKYTTKFELKFKTLLILILINIITIFR